MVYRTERMTVPKSETLISFYHYDSCITGVSSVWNSHLLLLCLSDCCHLILSAVPNLYDHTNGVSEDTNSYGQKSRPQLSMDFMKSGMRAHHCLAVHSLSEQAVGIFPYF